MWNFLGPNRYVKLHKDFRFLEKVTDLQNIITPKPIELGTWYSETMFTPTCVSHVTCHVSHVPCHMSQVTCHMSHVQCRKKQGPTRHRPMAHKILNNSFCVMRQSWDSHETVMRQSSPLLQALQTCLFLSVQLDDYWVSYVPTGWPHDQHRGHGKNYIFFWPIGGARWWRVRYQQDLPRLFLNQKC